MIHGSRLPCDDGVIRSGPERGECAERAKPWVLAATVLGSSLAFIVGSVVNVALPAIQRGLGASVAEMQWVINAYLLFLGALILVGGSAGDRFGRRRVFLIGTVVFTAASIWCGFARSPTGLIVARAVQGVGGALLVPASLAIITASFDEGERGRAIGTWAGFSALTGAGGPVLGGWLVDALSWRWIFFVIVPFAMVAVAITWWRVPETGNVEHEGLDPWGALLVTAGLGAVTYALIVSAELGLGHVRVLGILAAAALLLGLFLRVESRGRHPMLPLGLFRSRLFAGANLMTLFLYFALTGVLFFLPFNLIEVQGYSATATGAAFLPFTLVMGILSRWSGGLLDRFGARTPLVIGPLVAAAGLLLFALPDRGGSYWTTFFPPMLVLGVGMAISVAPLTTTVLNSVEERYAGVASGVNNAASRVAGLLAVGVLGAVLVSSFNSALDGQLQGRELSPVAERVVAEVRSDVTGAEIPPEVSGDARRVLEEAVESSFVEGFRWVVLISSALALASALCAALMIGGPRGGPDAEFRADGGS